jgi:hypothetical protein
MIRIRSGKLLASILILCSWLCIGWADSWEAIKAAAGDITSVQATFVQKKHLPILAKPLISKGTLSYQSPDALRWEYTTPIPSILLMHKGRVRRFTKDAQGFREQSNTAADAMQIVMAQITRWLTGRFDEDPMFDANLQPGRIILLKPRQKGLTAVLERVELYLDQQPGVIQRVLIFEGPDAYTELIFSQTILNQPIDTVVFQSIP